MLRSAAKNHQSVVVASFREQYAWIQNQMVERNGGTGPELRRLLARFAFEKTSEYESAIAQYFLPKNHGGA